MIKQKPVTYKSLVKGRAQVAKIIEKHGDIFWPLFERLDNECAKFEARNERLAQAKQIASAME